MNGLLWKCKLCEKEFDTNQITTLTTDPDSLVVCFDCCKKENKELVEFTDSLKGLSSAIDKCRKIK